MYIYLYISIYIYTHVCAVKHMWMCSVCVWYTQRHNTRTQVYMYRSCVWFSVNSNREGRWFPHSSVRCDVTRCTGCRVLALHYLSDAFLPQGHPAQRSVSLCRPRMVVLRLVQWCSAHCMCVIVRFYAGRTVGPSQKRPSRARSGPRRGF